jgi:hypothetical protein
VPLYLTWTRWRFQLLLDQLFQPLGHQGIEVWSSWAWDKKKKKKVNDYEISGLQKHLPDSNNSHVIGK